MLDHPLARGPHGVTSATARQFRTTPARAGTTAGAGAPVGWDGPPPLARGPPRGSGRIVRGARTTHSRGDHAAVGTPRGRAPRTTPARAGTTTAGRGSAGRRADHPRSRGDRSPRRDPAVISADHPRSARGPLPEKGPCRDLPRTTPARAGTTEAPTSAPGGCLYVLRQGIPVGFGWVRGCWGYAASSTPFGVRDS